MLTSPTTSPYTIERVMPEQKQENVMPQVQIYVQWPLKTREVRGYTFNGHAVVFALLKTALGAGEPVKVAATATIPELTTVCYFSVKMPVDLIIKAFPDVHWKQTKCRASQISWLRGRCGSRPGWGGSGLNCCASSFIGVTFTTLPIRTCYHILIWYKYCIIIPRLLSSCKYGTNYWLLVMIYGLQT